MTHLRHRLLTAALAVALLAIGSLPALAQTTLNSTTLAAAVNGGPGVQAQQIISLTSASTVAVGDYLIADQEIMQVNTITPNISVMRGTHGSAVRAHAALTKVWTGPPSRFYTNHVMGTCTASAETYLPHIVTAAGYEGPTASVYQCIGGYWQLNGDDSNYEIVRCWSGALFTSSVDQSCWTADRDYVIVKITESHTVAEAGGTLTLIPRKQTTTQAAASGTSLATALDETAAAETVRTATLSSTAGALNVAVGNRLGLDFTDDVAGELAGVLVMFYLLPR